MSKAIEDSGATAPHSPLGSVSSLAISGSPTHKFLAGEMEPNILSRATSTSRNSSDSSPAPPPDPNHVHRHKSGSQVGDPVPEMARQGRDNQRYAGTGERLVCGCIPYVRGEEEAGPSGGCRVLVITSRGGKGWVFPKGGWELDEDVEAAAARETVEEAGVRGVLTGGLIGVFEFHSGKQERRRQADQGRCIAHMFALDVQEVLESWPEGKERRRMWCTPQEAHDVLRHPWMKQALAAWAQRQGITLDTETWAKEPKPGARMSQSDGPTPAGGNALRAMS